MVSSGDVLKSSILIVDDQEANVSLLEEMLRGAGYVSLTSTRDPHEVGELHRLNRYSLILLDLEMPGLDGFQVMEGLKEIETSGYLPVLAITARPAHKLRALNAGAKDFVSKPFELGELLIRVNNMLEVRLLHLEIKRLLDQLIADNALLKAEISSRKRIEEALHRAQAQLALRAGQLEGLVVERTSELAATNKQLEVSVALIRKANQEHQALFLESKVMREKLSQLTRQIITAQEELQKEISRELHDEVVQALIAINVELTALGSGATAGAPAMKRKLAGVQRLVEKSVIEVHRFARGLRPAALDDLGLIPALHAYNKSLAERKKIKIHLTASAEVEALGDKERTVLFRVAQEALTNVVRHARATQVKMSITKIPGAIRMDICDNGRSFLVEKTVLAINPKRLGLVGMKERIEMVGGNLTIESPRGKGTTVRAEIPVTPK
jgi:two-component system sensor histidine kinase DegS